jgi:hypothetical protein
MYKNKRDQYFGGCNNITSDSEQDTSEFDKNCSDSVEDNNLEQDEGIKDEDDDFVQKTIDNNNLISIEHQHKFNQENVLSLADLNLILFHLHIIF